MVGGVHHVPRSSMPNGGSAFKKSSRDRKLSAVDCDRNGGIVMREIAVRLCVARGLLPLLSRNSHIEVDNQAILHSSF
jgi:hypothetical protein